MDPCRPVLVPGNIELVDIGVQTQTPELEVHLPGVLTRAGDDMGSVDLTLPGCPAIEIIHKYPTILAGVLSDAKHCTQAGVHSIASVEVFPISFQSNITTNYTINKSFDAFNIF